MMKNKKAQLDTIFNWAFIRIFILVIILGTLFIILTSHFNTGLNSYEVENLILIKRLTYSPNLLAYQDPDTNRVYPGIIDIEKFSTENLEENLVNKNKRLAVNMELTNLETNEMKRAYVNEQRARAWDDYVTIGGFDLSYLKRYVKIYDNDEFHPGILKVKVITKK